MILARGKRDGVGVLLIGLTPENLERMRKGEPMRVANDKHGDVVPRGFEIIIFFGASEHALVEDIRHNSNISRDAIATLGDPKDAH